MKFALYSKTNKDKSTEIFPPRLLIPTDICTSQKKSAKGSNFKEDDRGLCPSRSYYSV